MSRTLELAPDCPGACTICRGAGVVRTWEGPFRGTKARWVSRTCTGCRGGRLAPSVAPEPQWNVISPVDFEIGEGWPAPSTHRRTYASRCP